MSIDSQLTLLRMAARTDPHLRQAVADVDEEYSRLRDAAATVVRAAFEEADGPSYEALAELADLVGYAQPGSEANP